MDNRLSASAWGAIEPIIDERDKNGRFKSVDDLCRRSNLQAVNRRVLESLIKAGVFDTLEERGTLLNNIGRVLALAQREQRLRETGQSTMFDLWGETAPVPRPDLDLTPTDVSDREKAYWEKELMGVSFSEKPFSPVFSGANPDARFCGEIEAEMAGQNVVIAGRIVSARYLLTRDGRSFTSIILEDFSGQVEVMVWPKVYADTEELWQEGNETVVQGKVRVKDERVQINCENARFYEPAPAGEVAPLSVPTPVAPAEKIPATKLSVKRQRLTINIQQTADKNGDVARLDKIVAVLKSFPGRDEVRLNIINSGDAIPLRLTNVHINYNSELRQQLAGLVSEDGLRVEATE
jgi:DNA polymerase-3 subunit alpha